MKKILALVLAAIMLMSVASAETTLVKNYTLDEITSNTFHNGFVTAVGGNETNTLVLNDDGTYTYTKKLYAVDEEGNEKEDGVHIVYTFTGTYTQDGDTVVLAFPTACDWSEDWASLAASGYFMNGAGSAVWADDEATGDMVQCKEEEGHVPFDIFPGAFVLDTLVTSEAGFDAEECTVTITVNGDTFEYVIVNSDDD